MLPARRWASYFGGTGKLSVQPTDLFALHLLIHTESNAAEGPVIPAPVVRSTGVLPLVYDSVASFSQSFCEFRGFRWHCERRPPAAGKAAELLFSIRLAEALEEGARLEVALNGYQGSSRSLPITDQPLLAPDSAPGIEFEFKDHPYGCHSNEACRTLDYVGKGPIPLAQWDGASQRLTMTTVRPIAANATIRIVVPSASGIMLPQNGVPFRSILEQVTQFSLQIGPEITALSSFARLLPRVGAFHRFSVEFGSDVKAGEQISAFIISFVPAMGIGAGSTITITLQGFRNSRDESFEIDADVSQGDDQAATTWTVAWKTQTQILQLSPLGDVSARSVVRIVLNQGAKGIYLIPPAEGTQVSLPTSFSALEQIVPRILD